MKRSLLLSTAVLLLAAVFRLWQISTLPPGLHSDEAFHLLNAQLIASGRSFPVYITGNNGNEPLFAYLSAITLLILGPVTWAGRLTSAFVGLIGVAATIRLGDEMFPRRGVGALAGAALAALMWNVIFSRFGIQPILAPTAAAATLAALWRGARTGSRWAFALAGVSLGLGLAGYVAFRIFVFVPLVAGLALLVAHPGRRRALFTGGALAALCTLLVYSPLAVFFIQNPQWFFLRYSETTLLGPDASGLGALLDSANKTLGGLVLQGDPQWAHNLPGRPALDVPQTAFGVLGVGVLAWRWRKPQAVTLLAWLVAGLAPSVLSKEAPHFGRAIAVTPVLALLIGLGLSAAWHWANGSRPWQALIAAAGLLSLALSMFAFFGAWAHSVELWTAFETEEVDLGRAMLAAPRGARLIAPYAPPHPFTIEYVAGVSAYGGVETFDAADCMLLPTPASEPAAFALVNFPDTPVLSRLQAAYPAGAWNVYSVPKPGGQPYVGLFQIPAGLAPLAAVAVTRSADFGGFARLVGFTVTPNTPRPGRPLKLQAVWQVVQKTPTADKNFVHLLGAPKADGNVVYAQHDAQPCSDTIATTDWTAGDLLVQDTTLDLPADLPAGSYTLQTGWYDSPSGARAPVTDDAGPHANDAAQLQQVVIAQP